MRFNPDQVLALANLEGARDFETVLDALRAELSESTKRLLKATDPVQIHREQGAAEVLNTILDSAANARKRAQELKEAMARPAAGHPSKW